MGNWTIFKEVEKVKHDEDFVPKNLTDFEPTSEQPGSEAKIRVLARRVAKGQPLWHPDDFHCGGSGAYNGNLSGPGIRQYFAPVTRRKPPSDY